MKYQFLVTAAASLLAPSTRAFPSLQGPSPRAAPSLESLLGTFESAALSLTGDNPPQTNPPFDAKKQLVDVTGDHAWQAPGPNDQRGPCPGLNALANHGYLPRSGQASIVDFVSATTEVFGMATDLAAVLAVYGAALDGNLLGWNIGGQEHTGIGGSHNNYESDSSPMRGDLSQYGSNIDLVMAQFEELYNMQPDAATANYDISVLSQFRAKRFNESVSGNPNFMFAPFSGPGVTAAAFSFIYRFMANHTPEYPAGILDQNVLKSFFSVEGSDSNLTWVAGGERIPDNWYKRSSNDSYGFQGLAQDIDTIAAVQPSVAQAGCNNGTVNSFRAIDTSIGNGTYPKGGSVGADVLCLGFAAASTAAGEVDIAGFVVQELLLPVQNLFGCQTVPSINESVYEACPGYSLYGGPTAPVAKGAIPN